MFYNFPVIKHIDDVLPHIDDNFRVVEKEGLTYINYNHLMPEVFPDFMGETACQDIDVQLNISEYNHRAAIRRECRGIAFDTATGKLVSRPFHKFFNMNERVESVFDPSVPHDVYEKIDGSMIRPLRHPCGTIRLGTKMGVTDVALAAEAFIADKPEYLEFINLCIELGLTPIFEYTGPYNRVVLEYNEELILLVVRENISGNYRLDLERETENHPVKLCPKGVEPSKVKDLEGEEGVVIRYYNGHMVKVKSDWYVKAHRAKELLHSDRRFVESIVNGSFDDVIPTFLDDDRKKAEEKYKKFSQQVDDVIDYLGYVYAAASFVFESKKDFAIATKNEIKGFNSVLRQGVFKLWDKKVDSPSDFIWGLLASSVTSNTKFEQTMKNLEITFDKK